MSPVATWGTPHSCASSRAWVPLPAPGGPRKATRTLAPPREGPGGAGLRPLEEALVIPHEEMRLHLPHGVQGHAHHDEQAGTAEIEGHVEPADEEVGQHRDEREEERPRQGDAREHSVD